MKQASNCFRTVAARTTWPCKSPHSRSCPDVCKLLRPIRWHVAILCTYRAVGTAGGSSYSCSLKLFLKNPSLGDARVVLQFHRSEQHRAFTFKKKKNKYGMICASKFLWVSRLVYSFGNEACHTSAIDDAFCPILYTREISHNPKHSTFSILWLVLMHQSCEHSYSIVFTSLDCSKRNTLDSKIYFGFRLSYVGHKSPCDSSMLTIIFALSLPGILQNNFQPWTWCKELLGAESLQFWYSPLFQDNRMVQSRREWLRWNSFAEKSILWIYCVLKHFVLTFVLNLSWFCHVVSFILWRISHGIHGSEEHRLSSFLCIFSSCNQSWLDNRKQTEKRTNVANILHMHGIATLSSYAGSTLFPPESPWLARM